MNRFVKFLVLLAILMVAFFIFQWIRGFFADDVAARFADEEPFSIRFSVQTEEDAKLLSISRLMLYPAEKKAVFYFFLQLQ